MLHFPHLKADFPHFSPWYDPARLTDEGWYAGAAVRQMLSGSWHLRGDFNPAVAVPVFPTIVYLLFRVTGVSVVALRALNVAFFGAGLFATWLLVRRYSNSVAAAGAVFLCASSTFLYAYSRLGIVEPLLTLEYLLALLTASYITQEGARVRYILPSVATGVLLTAIVLTKTPGLLLYPAVFYVLLSRCHFNLRKFLPPLALTVGVASLLWVAYYVSLVRAGFAPDFHNLFAINNNHTHASILLPTLWSALIQGSRIGSILFFTSLVASLLSVIFRRRSLSPLFIASLLGIAGYGAFITYHGWLMPRYYLVPMPLVAIALVLSLAELAKARAPGVRLVASALTAVLFVFCIAQIRTLLTWSRAPDYSYVRAAEAMYRIIDRDPSNNRVVLGIVSEQMALLTGERGIFINDIYGTSALRERVIRSRPGWFITFYEISPIIKEALAGVSSAQLVETQPAFGDDGIHYNVKLYKLLPNNPDHTSPLR